MTRELATLLVGSVCCWGLAACDLGDPSETQSPELRTLKLTRNAAGDLEYCEPQADGPDVCQSLPYDGDCAIIEIDVNTQTGTTCERCILADGTVRDDGCQDTHIGCVLVTLPDPDCVVCAYVNGAIVFSTCVAEPVPQCYTDRDCLSDDGRAGFCVAGQCVYSDGCLSDADCPRGFVCELPPYAEPPGGGANSPVPYYGTCVPRDITCFDDADCPRGFYCDSWCYGTEPTDCGSDPGTDCLVAPPECEGVCQPYYNNPCENVDCPAGQHCEVQYVECFAYPCEPIPVCVSDPARCESDLDCGPGQFCRFDVCPMGPCTPGYCPPCYGVCTPEEPLYCYSDEECPFGQICSWYDLPPTDPTEPGGSQDPATGVWAPGICVPAPQRCETNADCRIVGELGYCVNGQCVFQFDCDVNHAFCDMMQPICPPGLVNSVVNGCFGPCIDPAACMPAEIECRGDEDCPPNHACVMYCWECNPNDATCLSGCQGVCVPNEPACTYDEDCRTVSGATGHCFDGMCVYDATECVSNDDCGEGQVCDVSCGGGVPCAEGDPNCLAPPVPCLGVCVPAPTDCVVGGCSGEICAAEPMASICIWQEEFACFWNARCERQASGHCGWTMTDELRVCLERN